MTYIELISQQFAAIYLTLGAPSYDAYMYCALPIRAENAQITFFAIFDPAEILAAQKRLERNGHMHVRPSPRIPYIGRRTTRCARVSVTCLL